MGVEGTTPMEITPEVLRTIRPAIEAVLNAEFQKQGLSFKLEGKFYPSSKNAHIKLEVTTIGEDGKVEDRPRQDYIAHAETFDCDPAWLDKPFRAGRKTLKVVGLRMSAPKNCVRLVDVQTLATLICPPSYVRTFLGSKTAKVVKPVVTDFVVVGPSNPDHVEIERRLAELRNDCPEGYYADGEHRAAGMSERAIHDMHYKQIAKRITDERNGVPPLFGSMPVMPAPPLPKR